MFKPSTLFSLAHTLAGVLYYNTVFLTYYPILMTQAHCVTLDEILNSTAVILPILLIGAFSLHAINLLYTKQQLHRDPLHHAILASCLESLRSVLFHN